MIRLSQLYRSPASLIVPLPQFLSKNPLPWAHISNTNQSIQGPHPNHLLYGGPQSGPLSTCPCHPRSRYRLTRVRLSVPLGLKQKLYPQIPLGGGSVQLSIFWSLALNRNRRNLHAPYRPGILNVLIHLKRILTSHTRFSQLLLMLLSRFSRVRLCATL